MNHESERQFPLSTSRIRKADREIKKAYLKQVTSTLDLNFAYLRRYVEKPDCTLDIDRFGGMVIAYTIPKKGHIVEVSTALCSPLDAFDKLEGKVKAANNFVSGAKIKIRLHEATRWGQQLAIMFSM